MPDSLTVDKAETAEEVVLVSLDSDVDAEQFPLGLRTHLRDHLGLTVTGQTSDEARVERTRTDDGLDILEVTPRDIGGKTRRDQGPHHAVVASSDRRNGLRRSRCGRRSRCRRTCDYSRSRSGPTVKFRDIEHTTVKAACLVSSNPGRPPERTIAGVQNGLDIGAIDRGSHTKGLGGVDECLSFRVHVVQCSVRVLLGPPSGGGISVVPVDCTIKGTPCEGQ